MITTAEQYNANLHLIYNINPPTYALLPNADNIYNIDVNTREIDAPQFLCVEGDHISETIYFIVDKFADYMDLSTTCCIITYTNAKGYSRFYAVPFYDIYTYASEKKMIIPWCLDADVSAAAGIVEFAIQFFKVGEKVDEDGNPFTAILYSLNTIPTQSKVLSNIKRQQTSKGYVIEASQYEELLQRINTVSNAVQQSTLWTIILD